MGKLIEGVWHDQWYDTKRTGGRFVRPDTSFRNWVTPDGAPGPTGEGGFEAEPGRYHLYVSFACPWAHRTLIFRKLKGLEELISITVTDSHMGGEGWTLGREDGCGEGPVRGISRLYEVYTKADPRYTGRVTVPVLWDKTRGTIVSNESAEIIRMLNSAFNGYLPPEKAALDFAPEDLLPVIGEVNALVYDTVNNGVYKAGFATSQEAYEEAASALFETLDRLETRLARQRYLAGARLTEADWRLFTTLVRFDAVYALHFKCNVRRIADYRNLSNYLRELYQVPGVAATVHMDHIKNHYYRSHPTVNPTRIVPLGPDQDFTAPHDRGRLKAAELTGLAG
ncbi:MAG: glutathione S-transferase family protein [Alphaproteobacteria bacterium]